MEEEGKDFSLRLFFRVRSGEGATIEGKGEGGKDDDEEEAVGARVEAISLSGLRAIVVLKLHRFVLREKGSRDEEELCTLDTNRRYISSFKGGLGGTVASLKTTTH